MAISLGDTLGPFQITARLGAGGMGEVYRARDTRLGRDIALKILPGDFASDPARLQRFEREARLASQLNHPNIVVLHEVGSSAGTHYLAMELVEGATLRRWAETTRPTMAKRLSVAAQIAAGLAHAHKAGVVHRDLKPENVMIGADGRARILDFGIARGLVAEPFERTETANLTAEGRLVGTVPYMSPEQARGGTADHRSDQFALGTLIHELVTGTHPFAGESSHHTLAAIIDKDVPPLTTTDPAVPLPLSWLVSRCLAKDPNERYESTLDLARDLSSIASYTTGATTPVVAAAPRGRFAVWATAAAALVAAAAGGWLLGTQSSRGDAVSPVEVPSFRQLTFRHGLLQGARFAGDSSSVVLAGAWNGGPLEVSTLRTDRPEMQALSLAAAGVFAVSSKGQLALVRNCIWAANRQQCQGTLASAPMAGQVPRDLAEEVVSADWAPDGSTMAVVRQVGTKYQLEHPLGRVIREGRSLGAVRFSRDGRHLAFFDLDPTEVFNDAHLVIIDVEGKGERSLATGLRAPQSLAWSSDGSEVWYTDNSEARLQEIYAATLDGRRRRVLQQFQALRLLDIAPDGAVLLTRSSNALRMFALTGGAPARSISWFDFTSADALSLDGNTVVFTERGQANQLPSYSLYVRDLDAAAPLFLGEGRGMAISPDKAWVVANRSVVDGPTEIIAYPTGAGSARVLLRGAQAARVDFLPDSKSIVFDGTRPEPATYLMKLDEGTPERVPHVAGRITSPLAPDGHRFISVEASGRYVVASLRGPLPTATVVRLNADEYVRQWTEDGRALYVQTTRRSSLDRVIERLDLATGQRTPVVTIAVSDPAGAVPGFTLAHLTRDARTIVYSEHWNRGDLILATGVR